MMIDTFDFETQTTIVIRDTWIVKLSPKNNVDLKYVESIAG